MMANKASMKKVTESYASTRTALIQKILTQSPVGLAQRSKLELERLALIPAREASEGMYVRFERADSSVDLHVEFVDSDTGRHPYKPSFTDEEGCEWSSLKVNADVNYPCHGSTDPATALARLAFYTQVALFAAEISVEFARPCWRLDRTASDVQAEELLKNQAATRTYFTNLVSLHISGRRMNVGKTIAVEAEHEFTGNPIMIAIKNRTYTVGARVGASNRSVYITRTA